MKIFKEEKKEVIYNKIIDIKCDICLNSCETDGRVSEYECLEITSNWGFYSNKDGEKWTAHICEECTDKYLKDLILFHKETYMERTNDKDFQKELNRVNDRKRKIREIRGLNVKIDIDEE